MVLPSLYPAQVRAMSDTGPHLTVQQLEYVTTVREHAWLASIAFLVVLPLGSLISRYFRTFTTKSVVPLSAELDTEPLQVVVCSLDSEFPRFWPADHCLMGQGSSGDGGRANGPP
jgi:hypothetical protein